MKILCECGNFIVDQTDYLPHKGYIIPDEDWFNLLDAIDDAIENPGLTEKDREKSLMGIRYLINSLTTMVWQCNSCGAIYIDRGNMLEHFKPSSCETAAGVLRSKKKK